MPRLRTRRRVRQIAPDVLVAIRDGLMTGASAPQVHEALMTGGQFPEDAIPSERTISNIAREMSAEPDEGLWRLANANPATAAVVLEVLAEVVRRTEGRVTTLTKAQADLIPIFHAAFEDWLRKLPPTGKAWQAYVWSRFYLSWVRSEQDELDFAVFLASVQSPGKWAPGVWFRQIERVNKAADGWLPEEFRRAIDE